MANRRRAVTGSVVAAVPIALGLMAPALGMGTTATATRTHHAAAHHAAAAKEFSVPLANLKTWADSVVVTLNNVKVEGRSGVHPLQSDCEMHFGAHTPTFQGNPDGLVLEPMNVCVQPAPGQSAQSNGDWTTFGDTLLHTTITATGVPRIWPEHLDGGTVSNPDHAVEIHPLTTLVGGSSSTPTDLSDNIFAGQYTGGVGEPTAFSMLENTTVDVTHQGPAVNISFSAGTIGNFTVLQVEIDRASIAGDGDGSFRMTGQVVVDDGTAIPVHLVSIKGTTMNTTVGKLRTGASTRATVEALVLFSLSPQALLDAANKSSGSPVAVDKPIQLILYGTPDDR